MSIKKIEQEEKKQQEEKVVKSIDVGNLGIGGEFDDLGLNETMYPRNAYDYVLFVLRDNPKYPLGTAFARSYGALKEGGKFVIDTTGAIVEEESIVSKKMFYEVDDEESGGGYLVFLK